MRNRIKYYVKWRETVLVSKEELTLQELKNIEFDLLKEFDAFCRQNQIRYFLAYGTLLGAVRYKGFIPWDDDVDVLVPREDYDKMIKLYKDRGRYRLYSTERNPKFGYPFSKLCDMTTKKEEENINNGIEQGIEIDIFPLDCWDNDIDIAKKEVKRLKRNMFGLNLAKMITCSASTPWKCFLLKTMMLGCRMLGNQFFIDRIIKIGKQKNPNGSAYMGDKVWCPYGERDICPAEVFSDSIKVEFEGQEFPAPIGYDTYLTRLYGDYLPEPPKERQKTHHKFKAYRISNVHYEAK